MKENQKLIVVSSGVFKIWFTEKITASFIKKKNVHVQYFTQLIF